MFVMGKLMTLTLVSLCGRCYKSQIQLFGWRNVPGCKVKFVQDGIHRGPIKPIQIGTECCDKCLTNCSESRTVVICITSNRETRTTPQTLTPRETIVTQATPIQTPKETIQPLITEIGPYAIKKTGIQRLLLNPE